MLAGQLKYRVAGWIKRNPYTLSLVWNMLPRLAFLLPHDKSYYGFRHLANHDTGLFLDVGANNGISAAGFRRINQTYDIISIEASRHHEKSLKRLQRKLPRFQYRHTGAGSKRDSLTLYTPMYRGIPIHTHASSSKDYLNVSLSRDFSPRVVNKMSFDEERIPVVPLDDLELKPDIIKVDVEGFDCEVLEGLRNTIGKHRPYVIIEYTPEEMGDFATFFAQRGYSLFTYDEVTDRFFPFQQEREKDTWETTALQVNIFCVPDERVSGLPVGSS